MSRIDSKIVAENERVKHKYLEWLTHAHRRGTKTVDMAAATIAEFERTIGGKNFKLFKPAWAISFKDSLETRLSQTTGQLLAPATIVTKLATIQGFFIWLCDQEGYRSRIRRSDVDYFNSSLRLSEAARSRNNLRAPSLEQVRHVLACLPAVTETERCIRAMIAFTLVSGGRADAIASMRLGNIDLDEKTVFFDGRTSRTKNSKSYVAAYFPVDEEIIGMVADWVIFLREDRLFGPNDPMFPAAEMTHDADHFYAATGRVARQTWKSSEPLRRHFRAACEAAGLPYFNPHSVRTTLGRLGLKVCRNPEEMKAFSQNFGHASLDTTARFYSRLSDDRQTELMLQMAARRPVSMRGVSQTSAAE